MYSERLICPNCGSNSIKDDDCLDIERNGNKLVEWHTGHCIKCKKEINWDKVFIFDHFEID